jgi:ADP-heptose:LPS heptosyltransferase
MTEPSRSPDDRPSLVVLRALGLGDLLVVVPAIRALARSYPGHRRILAAPAWLQPVARLIPDLDALKPTSGPNGPIEGWSGPVDLAVNLHGRGPESHRLLDSLQPWRRIGHRAPGWDGPEWIISEEVGGLHERQRWVRLLAAYSITADPDDIAIDRPATPSPAPDAVVIHVGAGHGARAWPVRRFAAVAATLARTGLHVVLSGGPNDADRARTAADQAGLGPESVLAGAMALDTAAALIAEARLLISADTGAAHLASAYRTPSVVIFGPAPPQEWGPPRNGLHRVLTDSRLRRGDPFAEDPDPALLAVDVDQVLAASEAFVAAQRVSGTE